MDGQCGCWTKRLQRTTAVPSSYLSDDQRAVLGGRGRLVALRVLHQHGLRGLRLSVAQPPAEAMGISDVRNQTSALTAMQKNDMYMRLGWKESFFSPPTQPGSPRPRRWTPLPPPGPPPRRLPRRWCPTPRSRRSSL